MVLLVTAAWNPPTSVLDKRISAGNWSTLRHVGRRPAWCFLHAVLGVFRWDEERVFIVACPLAAVAVTGCHVVASAGYSHVSLSVLRLVWSAGSLLSRSFANTLLIFECCGLHGRTPKEVVVEGGCEGGLLQISSHSLSIFIGTSIGF